MKNLIHLLHDSIEEEKIKNIGKRCNSYELQQSKCNKLRLIIEGLKVALNYLLLLNIKIYKTDNNTKVQNKN